MVRMEGAAASWTVTGGLLACGTGFSLSSPWIAAVETANVKYKG